VNDSSTTGLVIDANEGPLFLISDIHAGALETNQDDQARRMLDDLFRHIRRSDGRLIIIGDLFDYWQESGNRTPKQLQTWLDLFQRNQMPLKPTILITGNHDHWAGSALSNYGIVIVHDHVLVTTSQRPLLVLHGDGLPSDELKLIRTGLNRQFRNPFYNLAFKIVPLGARIGIMRAFSNFRKQRGLDHNENKHLEQHLSRWLDSHDFSGVVYGHTHEKLFRNKGGKYLVNTGTFSLDGTVMVLDGSTPTLTTVNELKMTDSAKMTYIMPDGTRR
jgi:UDP-2,3-diacylglucosamine pyrophosphatase LpxH